MDDIICNLELMGNISKSIFSKKDIIRETEKVSLYLGSSYKEKIEELKNELQQDTMYLEILTKRHNKFIEKII